jgi:excinuclease ABC subunit C
MFDIKEELKKLPQKPGVYLMKDEDGEVVYVGKAVNLKSRVRSYFRESGASDPKVASMVKRVKEFEYIVADSELEALILECNLIKELRPRYNILLKDDKAYPYIKATLLESYPRIFSVHRRDRDKEKYFGPYSDRGAMRETLALIHNVLPIRRCNKKFPRDFNKERPCFYYHLGRCCAPCAGNVDEKKYRELIDRAIDLLNGKHDDIIRSLENDMLTYSEEMEFEKAAETRDKIAAIRAVSQKQKVDFESEDKDVIAFSRDETNAMFQVFNIRGGKMIGRDNILIENVAQEPRREIMTGFIKQYYNDLSFIPKEILLEDEIDDREIIEKWFGELRGARVSILVPQKGPKRKLVEMARQNAFLTLEQFGKKILSDMKKTSGALGELAEALGVGKEIKREIKRIEAYDISNIRGADSVASMVVFENGKPKYSDYRKFKIKGALGADDYASMKEVLSRRFARYRKELEENQKTGFSVLPDAIFVDGGKGHVKVAEEVVGDFDIKNDIIIAGMVKDDSHRTRGLIYKGVEIRLPKEAFKLVTRVQDEVHRFAIEYHRKLREKIMVKSALDDIEFIGGKRKKALLEFFGDAENVRRASLEQLEKVVDKRSAASVYNYFN